VKSYPRAFAAAMAVASLGLVPSVAQAEIKPPKTVVVALGDSLSVGVQPDAAGKNQATKDGYNSVLAKRGGFKLKDFGCGGATSVSVVTSKNGKCVEHFGKLPYKNTSRKTSQLAAAEKYIKANRQRIAYVTFDIGGNDVASCAAGGTIDVACVNKGIANLKKYVPEIAKRLRKAAGKSTPIAAFTLYDPFLQQWFTNPSVAQASVGIAKTQVNDVLVKSYKAQKFKVADVATAFGTYKPFSQTTTYNGRAGVPVAVADVCKYTWMCAPAPRGPNIHATKSGYSLIADTMQKVLGKAAKKQ
jgi:lysophospholipase L1-like esterase